MFVKFSSIYEFSCCYFWFLSSFFIFLMAPILDLAFCETFFFGRIYFLLHFKKNSFSFIFFYWILFFHFKNVCTFLSSFLNTHTYTHSTNKIDKCFTHFVYNFLFSFLVSFLGTGVGCRSSSWGNTSDARGTWDHEKRGKQQLEKKN